MPVPNTYLRGYGLKKGMNLAGYQLSHINVGHETVVRYHEYRYPTTLIWTKVSTNANINDLMQQLHAIVGKDKTIKSQYGNPYSCHFGETSSHQNMDSDIVVTATGACKRVYR